MANLDDEIYINGFVAFRTRDAGTVRVNDSVGSFVERALSLRGEWPPRLPQPPIVLSSTRELLLSAAAYPLTTLHMEELYPDEAYIGVPQVIGQKSLSLREVTTAAEWSKTTTRYRYQDLTMVEVGGKYEEALFAVAKPLRT